MNWRQLRNVIETFDDEVLDSSAALKLVYTSERSDGRPGTAGYEVVTVRSVEITTLGPQLTAELDLDHHRV